MVNNIAAIPQYTRDMASLHRPHIAPMPSAAYCQLEISVWRKAQSIFRMFGVGFHAQAHALCMEANGGHGWFCVGRTRHARNLRRYFLFG